MPKYRSVLLLAIALLVGTVCGLAWWRVRAPGAGDVRGRTVADADASRDRTVRLEGHTDALPGATGSEPSAVSAPSPPSDAITGPPVLLRGTVLVAGSAGPSAFAPAVTIQVWTQRAPFAGVGDASVITAVERPGAFEVDVRPLLSEAGNEVTGRGLLLYVTHDAFVTVRMSVPVADVEALLDGRADLEPVDVVLRPAGRLHGRVLDADGERPSHTWVLLYRFAGAVPESDPVDQAALDDEGRFSLAYARDGRYLVVALRERYDAGYTTCVERSRPASEVVTLRRAQTHDEVPLRLQRGLAVDGRVRWGDVPVANADLSWSLVEEGTTLFLTSKRDWRDRFGHVAWVEDRVVWAGADERTALDGHFSVPGLADRPYRLTVERWHGALLHAKAEAGRERVVHPPAHDVEIDLPLARLDIEARYDGEPLEGLHVHVAAIGMDPDLPAGVVWDTRLCITDERGRAGLEISPACLYHVSVQGEAYAYFEETLRAPGAGRTHEVGITLVPAAPKPSLHVVFEGDGEDLAQAGFAFTEPDEDVRDASPALVRGEVEVSADGAFVLEDLVPGPWRLHVRPGRAWAELPGDWQEVVRLVDLPASGTARVTVRVERGGRLQVDVQDPEGRHPEAACAVLDADGREVPAWFRTEDLFGEVLLSTHHLPGGGACLVEPVLAPGSYTVRVAHPGYRPAERIVDIEAGRPAAVRITLEPE